VKIVRPTQAGPVRRPLDPAVLASGGSDAALLRGYVELVRTWRGAGPHDLRFRQDDIVVLVGILGSDAVEIERRLIALTGCTKQTARRLRRLLLVGLVALPVGVTATIVAASTAAPVDATGMTIDTLPHLPDFVETAVPPRTSSTLPPTTVPPTTVLPTTVPPTTVPPVVVPTGAEGTVSIPRLGIDLPIRLGGQSVIDEGVVAHYTAAGWLPPTPVGAEGTYWLAAHQSTHGAPFAALPDIAVGDEVTITTPSQTFTYTVTSMEVVERDAGFGPVYGDDPSARVILLQTCLDDVRRLLVHGTLTATS
jgi:LPXTG-site transpeptidase (sortase) family protein